MTLITYRAQLRALAEQKGVMLYDFLIEQGVPRSTAHAWVNGFAKDIGTHRAQAIAAKLAELPDVRIPIYRSRKPRADKLKRMREREAAERRGAGERTEASPHETRSQLASAG